MLFRDLIGFILQDVQANGDGAFSLIEPTPIDPRLLLPDSTRSSKAGSLTLFVPSKLPGRGLYNKSRAKRVKDKEETEDEDAPQPKKVDLGSVISGFSEEIKRARRAKESFLTVQQRAVQLLKKEYKGRLEIIAFLDVITWL
jgi:hypothetical protein